MQPELKLVPRDSRGTLIFTICCFLLLGAAFYPGFMSPDSLTQYSASKSLIFNDWHPPIMSWLWSVLNIYFKGPEGLMFFHLALLWSGLFVWHWKFREIKWSWIILLVGLFPWVINFSGVLWKDVGMAYALLLMMGLSLLKWSPTKIALILFLLFYALNLRHNALFAAAPIVYLMVSQSSKISSRLKSFTLTILLLVFTLTLGSIFNYEVLKSSQSHPSNYMMLDDLAYLSLKNHKSLIPGIALEDIQACSVREIGQNRLVGRDFCLSRKDSYIANNPYNEELGGIWLEQVFNSPIDYISFRLSAFSYLMRSENMAPYYIWQPGVDENDMGIKQDRNGATVVVEWIVKVTSDTFPFLFKPYWWLWFGMVLFFLTCVFVKNSITPIIWTLLISGILYMIGYIPATPMADFRYVYWSVIAISLAFVLLVIDLQNLKLVRLSSRYLVLMIMIIVVTFFMFNLEKIFHIDMNQIVLKEGSK